MSSDRCDDSPCNNGPIVMKVTAGSPGITEVSDVGVKASLCWHSPGLALLQGTAAAVVVLFLKKSPNLLSETSVKYVNVLTTLCLCGPSASDVLKVNFI